MSKIPNVKTSEVWTDRTGKAWPVEITSEDEQPKLVVFGNGGTTVHFSNSHRCTGEKSREAFFAPSRWWTHEWAERKGIEQWEGVPFVDLRAAVETEAGYRLCIAGPMVNVDLAEGEVDALPDVSPLMAGAMQGTSYGGLLTLQKASKVAGRKAGPLDGICVSEYMALWREVGADVGTIKAGQFSTQ